MSLLHHTVAGTVATVPIRYLRWYATGTTQQWSQIYDRTRQRVKSLRDQRNQGVLGPEREQMVCVIMSSTVVDSYVPLIPWLELRQQRGPAAVGLSQVWAVVPRVRMVVHQSHILKRMRRAHQKSSDLRQVYGSVPLLIHSFSRFLSPSSSSFLVITLSSFLSIYLIHMRESGHSSTPVPLSLSWGWWD